MCRTPNLTGEHWCTETLSISTTATHCSLGHPSVLLRHTAVSVIHQYYCDTLQSRSSISAAATHCSLGHPSVLLRHSAVSVIHQYYCDTLQSRSSISTTATVCSLGHPSVLLRHIAVSVIHQCCCDTLQSRSFQTDRNSYSVGYTLYYKLGSLRYKHLANDFIKFSIENDHSTVVAFLNAPPTPAKPLECTLKWPDTLVYV